MPKPAAKTKVSRSFTGSQRFHGPVVLSLAAALAAIGIYIVLRINAAGTSNGSAIAIDRNGSIVTIDTNGNQQSVLAAATDQTSYSEPTWSPDGKQLAMRVNNGIYRMQPGGSPVKVVDTGTTDDTPRWSPAGTQLSYTDFGDGSTNFTNVFIVNVDGTGKTKLTNNTSNSILISQADWTRQNTIVYGYYDPNNDSNKNGLWQVNPDGSGSKQLNQSPSQFLDLEPSVSPDGTKIAFIRNAANGSGAAVFVMNSDGSSAQALTNGQYSDFDVSWAPDGSSLLFSRSQLLSSGIWTADIYQILPDGSGLRQVTDDPDHQDFQPSWQPVVAGATPPPPPPAPTPTPTPPPPSPTPTPTPPPPSPQPTPQPSPSPSPSPSPAPSPSPQPAPTTSCTPSKTMYVSGSSGANLRKGPATTFQIEERIPYKAAVTAGCLSNGWYSVIYGDAHGYVAGSLLATTKPAGSASPPPPPAPTAQLVPTNPAADVPTQTTSSDLSSSDSGSEQIQTPAHQNFFQRLWAQIIALAKKALHR